MYQGNKRSATYYTQWLENNVWVRGNCMDEELKCMEMVYFLYSLEYCIAPKDQYICGKWRNLIHAVEI